MGFIFQKNFISFENLILENIFFFGNFSIVKNFTIKLIIISISINRQHQHTIFHTISMYHYQAQCNHVYAIFIRFKHVNIFLFLYFITFLSFLTFPLNFLLLFGQKENEVIIILFFSLTRRRRWWKKELNKYL